MQGWVSRKCHVNNIFRQVRVLLTMILIHGMCPNINNRSSVGWVRCEIQSEKTPRQVNGTTSRYR
jgi:hypothetical protein